MMKPKKLQMHIHYASRFSAKGFAVFAAAMFLTHAAMAEISFNKSLKAETKTIFANEVATAFPIGSDESELLKFLKQRKFLFSKSNCTNQCDGKQKLAYLVKSGSMTDPIPCDYQWNILWTAAAGKIRSIEGKYGTTCP